MSKRRDFDEDEGQPTHIIFLKVLFFLSIVVFIAGVILLVQGPQQGKTTMSIVGIALCGASILTAGISFGTAFEPELTKMKMKKERYIQKETEHIQEDMSARNADIKYRATKKSARAFSEGWRLEKCPFCGDKVSGDEQFCDKCGKSLYSQCKSCKTINTGDSKFCKKCGKEL